MTIMRFKKFYDDNRVFYLRGFSFSLGAKIVLLVSGVTFLTAFLIGGFFYKRISDAAWENSVQDVSNQTRLIATLLRSSLDEMRYDVLALSKTPPVQGLVRSTQHGGVDPVDGSTTEQWRERLATIFSSMITPKSGYIQIRYIGVADHGREMVRVNSQDGVSEVVPLDALQSKADESYYKHALSLPPGRVSFSDMSLNREHGKIQRPLTPVIRVIVPVFDDKNTLFGMIVINAAFAGVMRNVLETLAVDTDLYVVSERGDYILHRQKSREDEVYFDGNAQDNVLVKTVLSAEEGEDTVFWGGNESAQIAHYLKVFFDPMDPKRFVGVAVAKSRAEFMRASHDARQSALLLAAGLVVLAGLCAFVLSFFLSRPLKKTIAAVRGFGQGEIRSDLPVHLRDEIGELARAFEALQRGLSEAREAEQLSLAKLQAILDNTVDGFVTINDQGLVKGYNKACEDIFGYTPDEVLGRNVKMLMPEPYRSGHDGYLEHYRETGEKKIIGMGREVRGMRKDGSVFPLDLSVSEVRFQGRKIYSGIIRDITDRKDAEEEIVRSNEELERFAYVASHDLQEPLRMVANFTALLEDEYGEQLDAQASEYMAFIIDAARRMQTMVGDLLEYSRIGNENSGLADVDCESHVKMAMDNLQELIEETGASVSVGDLPVVRAHPVRFTRLMQNLIGNGIKYRRQGVFPEITIHAEDQGEEWVFTVSDNGIGMKEEYLEQIFIIFKRLHGKRDYQGTGIGLAVCKKIVEGFDGKIWAASTPGEGSIFYFTVPKEREEKKAA